MSRSVADGSPATVAKELPKRPGRWPPWGDLPAIRRDMLAFLTRKGEHESPTWIRFGPHHGVLLTRADQVKAVLDEPGAVAKSELFRVLERVVGRGLVTAEDDDAKAERDLIGPVFRDLDKYSEVMREETERMLDKWRKSPDGTCDAKADLEALTLRVVAQTLFGRELDDRTIHTVSTAMSEVRAAMAAIVESLEVVLPAWVPTRKARRLSSAVRRIDRVVNQMIAARRRKPGGDDLLGVLMEKYGSGPDGDRRLRDQLMTFFLAGHGTTAAALAWTVSLLARNPAVQDVFQAKIAEATGGGPLDVGTIVRKLSYDNLVFKEALRLYPPVFLIDRVTARDVVAGGYRIPKGTRIFISPWVLQRDGRLFEEPLAFKPERWDVPQKEQPFRRAWIPFGSGDRACMGYGFALLEATIVLSLVFHNFRMEPVGAAPSPYASITLRPRDELWLRALPRETETTKAA